MERPTGDEYRKAIEDGEDGIKVKYLPNPDQEKPAMVIGMVSKSVAAFRPDQYGSGEPLDRFWWTHGETRTFYILKRSIRGKRFLVALEDIVWEGGAT